jgi:hypothetical protein
VKELNIQELKEDNMENISDLFKEVTNDTFQCVAQQQDEMNIKMQEHMVELRHMLETKRIMLA